LSAIHCLTIHWSRRGGRPPYRSQSDALAAPRLSSGVIRLYAHRPDRVKVTRISSCVSCTCGDALRGALRVPSSILRRGARLERFWRNSPCADSQLATALKGCCSRSAVVEPGMSAADALRRVRGRASTAATQPIHPGRFVVRDDADPSIARARAVAKLRRLLQGLAARQHRGAFAGRPSAAHARARAELPLAASRSGPQRASWRVRRRLFSPTRMSGARLRTHQPVRRPRVPDPWDSRA
jgi:hypothetical protein